MVSHILNTRYSEKRISVRYPLRHLQRLITVR